MRWRRGGRKAIEQTSLLSPKTGTLRVVGETMSYPAIEKAFRDPAWYGQLAKTLQHTRIAKPEWTQNQV